MIDAANVTPQSGPVTKRAPIRRQRVVYRLPGYLLAVMAIEAQSRRRLGNARSMARCAGNRSVSPGKGKSGGKMIEWRADRLSTDRGNKKHRGDCDDHRHRNEPRKSSQ
jgi:hypothetical protein